MIDLKNKTALEFHFADHFDTALFPVLADIYLQTGDLRRAKKVCEIGLGYTPNNKDGLYTLAKVHLVGGNLKNAENVLKTLLTNKLFHLQGIILLAHIQVELNRSSGTIKSTWERVLEIDPHHLEATKTLKQLKKGPKSTSIKKEKPFGKRGTPKGSRIREEHLESFSISPKLATFTLVKVLENQGLYFQALHVLDVLSKKGGNLKKISQEKNRIKKKTQSENT